MVYEWDQESFQPIAMGCGTIVPLVSMMYSEQDDCIGISSDDEYTTSMCDLHNVNITVFRDGFEFDLAFLTSEEKLDEAPHQFGDTGSVKTFREECQLKDSTPNMMDTKKHSTARAHTTIPEDDMTVRRQQQLYSRTKDHHQRN
jgi:hypothetical protein